MLEDGSDRVRAGLRRGRGATRNPANRFDATAREGFDDGWGGVAAEAPLRRRVTLDTSRSVIARNTSPDVPFDRSLNPYRGCEHGCIYCFARPTHAWLGLSPGLDFETQLLAKPDAARLLRRALGRRGYRVDTLAIGTNTDPYQPLERDLGIMRAVLEVLEETGHPVSVVTKGGLIRRDADILGRMGRRGLAAAGITLTTLDPGLARRLEPRAAAPAHRLAAIRAVAAAGCPVRVLVAPVIPGLNDHELEACLQAAQEAGATAASYTVLRLPREVAGLFRDWLADHYPDRARRVMRGVRALHGGKDYDPDWDRRMTGQGVEAALIASRFALARRRLGLRDGFPALRRDLFRPPARAAPPDQPSLF